MRALGWILAVGLVLPACGGPPPDPAQLCLDRFKAFDRALAFERLKQRSRDPGNVFGLDEKPSSGLLAAENGVRQAGCVSRSTDAVDLTNPRERFAALRNGDSGRDREPQFYHVGILADPADERALTAFFAALGYPVRTEFAPRVGSRMYLGPIMSTGAALAVEELVAKIGFPSGYYVTRIPTAR